MAAPGRGWPDDAAPNIRTSGRVDGSIIAAIITCHATRNSGSAIHTGGPPSIRASWCSSEAAPAAWAARATAHAPAIATTTASG